MTSVSPSHCQKVMTFRRGVVPETWTRRETDLLGRESIGVFKKGVIEIQKRIHSGTVPPQETRGIYFSIGTRKGMRLKGIRDIERNEKRLRELLKTQTHINKNKQIVDKLVTEILHSNIRSTPILETKQKTPNRSKTLIWTVYYLWVTQIHNLLTY